MNFKRIFLPWLVLSELDQSIDDLQDEVTKQDEQLDDLAENSLELLKELETISAIANLAARDAAILILATTDMVATVDGVATPNGTSKKLQRMAQEAIDSLTAVVNEETIQDARALIEAEEAAAEEELPDSDASAESIEDEA